MPYRCPNLNIQHLNHPKQKSPANPYLYVLQGFMFAWDRAESNRRHMDFQSIALPTELQSLTEEKYTGFLIKDKREML